jgi:hypothetical protein
MPFCYCVRHPVRSKRPAIIFVAAGLFVAELLISPVTASEPPGGVSSMSNENPIGRHTIDAHDHMQNGGKPISKTNTETDNALGFDLVYNSYTRDLVGSSVGLAVRGGYSRKRPVVLDLFIGAGGSGTYFLEPGLRILLPRESVLPYLRIGWGWRWRCRRWPFDIDGHRRI